MTCCRMMCAPSITWRMWHGIPRPRSAFCYYLWLAGPPDKGVPGGLPGSGRMGFIKDKVTEFCGAVTLKQLLFWLFLLFCAWTLLMRHPADDTLTYHVPGDF